MRLLRTAAILVLIGMITMVAFAPRTPAEEASTGPSCEEGSAHAYLLMTTLDTPWDGCTVVIPSTFGIVEVWANPTVAITKVRFSIQQPDFGTIVDATYDYVHTGDLATGVELDLVECQPPGAIKLATLIVVVTDGMINGCVPWQVDDYPEVVDCTGATRPALARPHDFAIGEGCCFYIDCPSLPPYNLYPHDGALNVPTNVALSWANAYGYVQVRISTDPACYTGVEYYPTGNTFSPDFLLPETTYYWQVGWSDGLECGGLSPTFSFTTEGGVPVQPETWGRIKALYH